jgi:hypothetical protein
VLPTDFKRSSALQHVDLFHKFLSTNEINSASTTPPSEPVHAYCQYETGTEWIHVNGFNLSAYNSSIVPMKRTAPRDDDLEQHHAADINVLHFNTRCVTGLPISTSVNTNTRCMTSE